MRPQADGVAALLAALAPACKNAARAKEGHSDAQRTGHVEGPADLAHSVGQSIPTVLGTGLGYAGGAIARGQAGGHVS